MPVALSEEESAKVALHRIVPVHGDLDGNFSHTARYTNNTDYTITTVMVNYHIIDPKEDVPLWVTSFVDAATGLSGPLLPGAVGDGKVAGNHYKLRAGRDVKHRYQPGRKATGYPPDVRLPGSLGLFAAVARGDGEEVGRILEISPDLATTPAGSSNVHMIHVAAASDNLEALELALKSGASLAQGNGTGDTPLMVALRAGSTHIVKRLLAENAPLGEKSGGLGPLQWAAKNGNAEICRALLEGGAKVNSKNYYFTSPLVLAAESGSLETVKLLIEKGAELDKLDRVLGTPLHQAAIGGNAEIVEVLIRAGAEVDKVYSTQLPRNALTLAAQHSHLEVIKVLLNYGANPMHKDEHRRTALRWAESMSHRKSEDLEYQKWFIERNAEIRKILKDAMSRREVP